MSMYNVAWLLDHKTCVGLPDGSGAHNISGDCSGRLQMSIVPWLIFLPSFSFGTILLKTRLARSLHDAWFQPARPLTDEGGDRERVAPLPLLPPPDILFRVTPTFYSRSYDADPLSQPSVARSHLLTSAVSHRSLDPSTSILSARGATFADMLESEQLCFICYSQPPNAVLLECGHAGLCVDCAVHMMERRASSYANCPICRTRISTAMRLRAELPVPSNYFEKRGGATLHRPPSAPDLGRRPATVADLERGGISELSAEGGAVVPGPPYPAGAKSRAVVVEVARRIGDRGGNRWRRMRQLEEGV